MVGGRHPWVEDNLWWKITFGGRRPSVEQTMVEDDLQWNNLWWNKTFGRRRPSVEDDFRWKNPFVSSDKLQLQ